MYQHHEIDTFMYVSFSIKNNFRNDFSRDYLSYFIIFRLFSSKLTRSLHNHYAKILCSTWNYRSFYLYFY